MSSSRVHAAITCSAPIAALTDPNPWAPAVAMLLPGAHVISIVPRKQATPHMITMRLAGLNMRDVVEVMHKDASAALILARKPLESTVADSVKRWGTGAINVDATRIANEGDAGRWPANLMLDDVAREALDEPGRFFARTADVLAFAVRLICPPGALVLDPFRDATSPIAPVVAAEGFTFVGGA